MLTSPAIVGYFSYMQRILKAPLGLIFGAISQVLFRFAAKNADRAGHVRQKLRQIAILDLAILAIAALAVVAAWMLIDRIEFMREWAGLKPYMPAFSAWMLVPFVFAPFASLPVVYERQKRFFQVATTYNLVSLLFLGLGLWLAGPVIAFWSMALLSSIYFLMLRHWVFGIVARDS